MKMNTKRYENLIAQDKKIDHHEDYNIHGKQYMKNFFHFGF